jgi:hypothetical protein
VIEGVPPHTVHDLTSRMLAKSKASLAAFNASFKSQASGTALGFAHASNGKSTNDKGKNVTGITVVGACSADRLTQWKGRISRVVSLEEGDIVPERFTLTHIRIEWEEALAKGMASRAKSFAGLAKPGGMDALLAKAKKVHPAQAERIAAKAAQLLKMDASKVLGDSDMATSYLTALTDERAMDAAQAAYMEKRSNSTFDPYEEESGDAILTHAELFGEEDEDGE